MFTVLHQQLLATTRDKHKASAGHLKKRKAKEMVEEVQMEVEEELQVEEDHMDEEEHMEEEEV